MRNFIIVGHCAVTTAPFSLNDLPGSSGRMDLITRAVNSSFCISHDIRRDVEVVVVLLGPEAPPKTIRFLGRELKYLNPDERSTGALIRNALIKYQQHSATAKEKNNEVKNVTNNEMASSPLTPAGELRASPGIYISENNLNEILAHYSPKSKIVHLHENGKDISHYTQFFEDEEDLTFVLSDHKDFTEDELELIKEHSSLEISLGPTTIHTDQCVTIIHNHVDRLGMSIKQRSE